MKYLFGILMFFSAAVASAGSSVSFDKLSNQNHLALAGFSAEFVNIKAGSFKMGSPVSELGRYDDETQHDVTISKDFEIQSTVVTQGQFFLVMGFNPSSFNDESYCKNDHVLINGFNICPNNPVESVSWNDTQDFLKKLNASDEQYQYRLPSEAEWEYSARGGSQDAYWYGNDFQHLNDFVWYSNNSNSNTHTVRTKPANPFGLYDVEGNVWQWVEDLYSRSYEKSPQTDPLGPTWGSYHVMRGGGWNSSAREVRVANRSYGASSKCFPQVGFRLVRTVK